MGSRSRLWLDVTTTARAGAVHDGTTRVERALVRELPEAIGPTLAYCTYNPTLRRFGAVARPQLVDDTARPKHENVAVDGPLKRIGQRIERRMRRVIKGAIARGQDRLETVSGRALFADAQAGDTMLLAGENWSRYDFDVMRRLRDENGVRIAAVLQDMIPHVHPQFFESAAFVARFRTYVDFLASDTDLVLNISDSTRADFLDAAPNADPGRALRIELGADFTQSAERHKPAGLALRDGHPFVLSVSTIQARKNFDLLYRVWQKYGRDGQDEASTQKALPHLVIVGKPGFASSDLLHLMRNDPAVADTVTLLHGPSDAELGWLYEHCLFTLYPSWYEGWGLPLSESLASGKTFIASNTSSMPEAGQGLGLHLDPFDAARWADEIAALAADHDRLTAMERRILSERQMVSWADCAHSVAKALKAGGILPQ